MVTSGAIWFWSRFMPIAHAVRPAATASRTAWKTPNDAASTLWISTSAPLPSCATAASFAAATSSQFPMNVSSTWISGFTARAPASNAPFDLIFNDGDKQQYEPLLDRLVTLLRPGGVLVTDNVLWDGEVVPGLVTPPQRDPADTAAIAAYNHRLAADDRLATSFVPLRDGLAVSVRRRSA